MSINSIDENMSDHDRKLVQTADQVWQRIARTDGHWEDWSLIGAALMAGRQHILRSLHLNAPRGRGYNETFGAWRSRHYPAMPPGVCTDLLFLGEPENLAIVNELRRGMSDAERLRVTHPSSMAKRVRARLKERGEGLPVAKSSPLARLKMEKTELERQLADAKERLAGAEAGSLFDWESTGADIVARVLYDPKPRKAVALAKAILDLDKKRKAKPAG